MMTALSATGVLPLVFQQMLETYDDDIGQSAVFVFESPDLQKRFERFSAAFDELDAYLVNNFLPAKKGNAYELFPHPQRGNAEQRQSQREKLEELREMIKNFERAYYEFVGTAARTSSQSNDIAPIVHKGKKRITLPRFPRTEWTRVSLKFVDERNVLLSNGKDVKPCDFEGLGCMDDRTERPNDAWDFLRELASGGGTSEPRSKKERGRAKKHKQTVTDILRKIFQNDTDPFETDKGGIYRAKFGIEYTENARETSPKVSDGKLADLSQVYKEMTEPKEDE